MLRKIIKILRKNSRINIKDIAHKLKINQSTFYGHFKSIPRLKFVSLIDFSKFNYIICMFITEKDPVFLEEASINNIFELKNSYLIEAVFKNNIERYDFIEKYSNLIIYNSQVLEIIKKESFLSK